MDGGRWGDRSDVSFVGGSSLSFDGQDGYVEIPYSDNLSLDGDFSVEEWFKVREGGGVPVFQVDGIKVGGSEPIEPGRWYHMVVIWDNWWGRLYLNGVLDGEHSRSDPNRVDRSFSHAFWSKSWWAPPIYWGRHGG